MIQTVLNQHCILCGTRSKQVTCLSCWEDQQALVQQCPVCALPLTSSTNPSDTDQTSGCPDCISLPKPFNRTIAAFRYQSPTNYLVRQFKQQKHLALGEMLAQTLAYRVAEAYSGQRLPDAIVPIPQHWIKQLKRGLNPAAYIAHHLSGQLEIPVKNLLKKRFATQAQQSLDRKERLKNLEDVFVARRSAEGLHLAVVDDVMTTTATAICTADTLLRAGARCIDIWAVARTPKK